MDQKYQGQEDAKSEGRRIVQILRARCNRQETWIVSDPYGDGADNSEHGYLQSTDALVLFKPLILTDCCRLFSWVIQLRPNTLERCSRALTAYLRDTQSMITFSCIDSDANLCDVNAKNAGSLELLADFFQ